MTTTEAAPTDRDDTALGHDAELARTDPELVRYVDDFVFDEVRRHGDLEDTTRLMTQIAAAIAIGSMRRLRVLLEAALTAGVTPVEAKEVVYQAVPYVGIARAVDAVHTTNEVLQDRGVELPLPGRSTTTPETRMEQGLAVQKEIVGSERVEAMYADAPSDEAHIQRYLSANCFGDHYTRGGVDVPTRELLTLSMLAALGGADPQVRGHVAANLRVGNDRARMIAVVTQLLPYIGYPRTLNALRAIDEVAPPAGVA